jgi:hypothetical protein
VEPWDVQQRPHRPPPGVEGGADVRCRSLHAEGTGEGFEQIVSAEEQAGGRGRGADLIREPIEVASRDAGHVDRGDKQK